MQMAIASVGYQHPGCEIPDQVDNFRCLVIHSGISPADQVLRVWFQTLCNVAL